MPLTTNDNATNAEEVIDGDASKKVEVALTVPLLPALRDMSKPKIDKTVSFDVTEKENKNEVISKDMIKGRRPLSNISNNFDQPDHSKAKKKSPVSAPGHAKRKIIPSPTNTTTMGFNVTAATTGDTLVYNIKDKVDNSLIPVEIKPSADIKELVPLYQANSAKSQPSTVVTKNVADTQSATTISSTSQSMPTLSDNIKSNKRVIIIATLITILSIIVACLSLTYSLSHSRVQSLDEALYFKNGKLDLEKVKFTQQIYDGMPSNMPIGLRQESAKLATYKVYKSKNDGSAVEKKENIDKGITVAMHALKKFLFAPFKFVGDLFNKWFLHR